MSIRFKFFDKIKTILLNRIFELYKQYVCILSIFIKHNFNKIKFEY